MIIFLQKGKLLKVKEDKGGEGEGVLKRDQKVGIKMPNTLICSLFNPIFLVTDFMLCLFSNHSEMEKEY